MGVYDNGDDDIVETGYTKALKVIANSPPGNENHPDNQSAAQDNISKAKFRLQRPLRLHSNSQ